MKDGNERLVGTVGLRELTEPGATVGSNLAAPVVARADERAMSLLPALTSGAIHAVIIVDEDHHVLGLISQTDLLAAAARALFDHNAGHEQAA